MFSYLNFIIHDDSVKIPVLDGNPESGTEFIPNSDRLQEKMTHLRSTSHHPK
jgi:hypothetical protein